MDKFDRATLVIRSYPHKYLLQMRRTKINVNQNGI